MNVDEGLAVDLIAARQLSLQGRDVRRITDELTRLRRGVYVQTSDWAASSREQRHLLSVRAALETRRTRPVLAHVSAGIIWGLPIVGPYLDHVHFVAPSRSSVHTKNGVIWHHARVEASEVIEHSGFLVTSFRRTVLDIIRTLPFASTVAIVDVVLDAAAKQPEHPALAGVDREALLAELDLARGGRGVRAARAAVEFGDRRSGSPGESISRANMHLLGYPRPQLQVSFRRSGGGRDIVDFDWPELGTFGEFDGEGKYLRPEYLQGRTTAEAVLLEKERENRVRLHRPFGARWGWTEAMSPRRLDVELRKAGLRPIRETR